MSKKTSDASDGFGRPRTENKQCGFGKYDEDGSRMIRTAGETGFRSDSESDDGKL